MNGVAIGGVAHDVVIAATNHNSVHCLDAASGASLWATTVQRAMHGGVVSALPNVDTMGAGTGDDAWGVTSTPVVDLASQSLFVTSTVCAVSPHYFLPHDHGSL